MDLNAAVVVVVLRVENEGILWVEPLGLDRAIGFLLTSTSLPLSWVLQFRILFREGISPRFDKHACIRTSTSG